MPITAPDTTNTVPSQFGTWTWRRLKEPLNALTATGPGMLGFPENEA
jgi:hypothetical protein